MDGRGVILVGLAGVLVLGGCARMYTGKLPEARTARATISGQGISGEARLVEQYDGRVRVMLKVEGTAESKLTPGKHAIHIHETGNCEPFTAAKGHYDGNVDPQRNPEANVSPGLGNHPYHLGDLPNLLVDDNRKGSLYATTSRVSLGGGLNTVFDADGSAFIIHALEDQYLPDPPNKDAPGGARIACGVITKE